MNTKFQASEIGIALSLAGIISCASQIFLVPVLLKRYDHVKLYKTTLYFWAYCFVALPLVCIIARIGLEGVEVEGSLTLAHADVSVRALVWCGIAGLLVLSKLACLPFAYVYSSLLSSQIR
jgi:hypothetical protein